MAEQTKQPRPELAWACIDADAQVWALGRVDGELLKDGRAYVHPAGEVSDGEWTYRVSLAGGREITGVGRDRKKAQAAAEFELLFDRKGPFVRAPGAGKAAVPE